MRGQASALTAILAAALAAGTHEPLAGDAGSASAASSTADARRWVRMIRRFGSGGDSGGVAVDPVPGGLSNRNYRVWAPDTAESFIMRVPGDLALPPTHNYTRVHLVNRSLEARCAASAAAAGVAPELIEYLWEPNATGVMLTRWLDGAVLNARTFSSNVDAVGRTLRAFHDTVDLGEAVAASVPPFSALARARNYLSLAQELGVTLPDGFDDAFERAEAAETALLSLPPVGGSPVALHCDLIPGNFILEPASASGKLWLFDFEYCHRGDRAWDLANVIAFNGLGPEDQTRFLRAYGDVGSGIAGGTGADRRGVSSNSGHPTALTLDHRIDVMTWLFGFSEGLWGVVQEVVSDLPFDAGWADDGVGSFFEYGERFLVGAAGRLDDDARLQSALNALALSSTARAASQQSARQRRVDL